MKRWIVGSLAAGSAVAGLTGAVLAWQKGPGVRRVNESIAQFTDHWEGVAASNAGGDGVIQFVALGDSSVQGVGASSPESSWVSVLAERIEERTGRPVEIYNLSVSGAIAAEVLREQIASITRSGSKGNSLMRGICSRRTSAAIAPETVPPSRSA